MKFIVNRAEAEFRPPGAKERPARSLETSPATHDDNLRQAIPVEAVAQSTTLCASPLPNAPENPQPALVTIENNDDQLISRIAHTRFDPNNPPPTEICTLQLSGVEIAHTGNLVTIAAAVKTGKSSVISAIIGSLFGNPNRDYLAFKGDNPEGQAVLHFDTEQSRGDHWNMGMRTLRRAGLEAPPSWFNSYSLTMLTPVERRNVIRALARQAATNGGLHSIFIDGVADLALDVNDLREACDLVTELHQLAIETNCVIVTALHHNPGGEKSRGHLGSQIERKSESVLVLRREGEQVSISCQPARRHEVSGDKAPRFYWDPHSEMHKISSAKVVTRAERKRVDLRLIADEVFESGRSMKWTDLCKAIMDARGWSKNTAGTRIKEMLAMQVIKMPVKGYYTMDNTGDSNPNSNPVLPQNGVPPQNPT